MLAKSKNIEIVESKWADLEKLQIEGGLLAYEGK
jgi:hypothetical protein